jgi:hypothetical protein
MLTTSQRITPKKQKLIDNFLKSKIQVGERIVGLVKSWSNEEKKTNLTVIDITDDFLVCRTDSSSKDNINLPFDKVVARSTFDIGVNPTDPTSERLQAIQYSLDSIFFDLGLNMKESDFNKSTDIVHGIQVPRVNFNPYVLDKNGNKQYFQRELVWKLKDKQLLIESLYLGVDCGTILVKPYSYHYVEKLVKNGETELAWKDVIDGKQRLHALLDFLDGKFKDIHGNFWGDLSAIAQNKIMSSQQFKYVQLPEDSSDEIVLKQFLRLNYAGVPQSKDHLKTVSQMLVNVK